MSVARLTSSRSAGFHDVERIGTDNRSLCGLRQHWRAWFENSTAPVTCSTCIARRAPMTPEIPKAPESGPRSKAPPPLPFIRGRFRGARLERRSA